MNILKRDTRPQLAAIAQALNEQYPTPDAQPPTHPLPSYIQPNPDVSAVGQLSAQAMAAEFEASAQTLQKMGAELNELLSKCHADTVAVAARLEGLRQQVAEALEDCNRSAGEYRDAASRTHARIEKAALLAEEVRRKCQTMIGRVKAEEPSGPAE